MIATKATAAALLRAHELYLREQDATIRKVWEEGYMSDLDGTTSRINEHISWSHIEAQARENGWVAAKAEFWKRIKHRVLAKMESDIIRTEIDEIQQLAKIRHRAILHAVGGVDEENGIVVKAAEPKSFEGAVGAVVRLDQRLGEKRRSAAGAVAAATDREATEAQVSARTAPPVPDALSPEEALRLARDLASRRAGVPDAVPQVTAAIDDDEDD